MALTMRAPDILNRGQHDGLCLLYRPPTVPVFCFEPVTHPIDAFHMPGIPGLRVLHPGGYAQKSTRRCGKDGVSVFVIHYV